MLNPRTRAVDVATAVAGARRILVGCVLESVVYGGNFVLIFRRGPPATFPYSHEFPSVALAFEANAWIGAKVEWESTVSGLARAMRAGRDADSAMAYALIWGKSQGSSRVISVDLTPGTLTLSTEGIPELSIENHTEFSDIAWSLHVVPPDAGIFVGEPIMACAMDGELFSRLPEDFTRLQSS